MARENNSMDDAFDFSIIETSSGGNTKVIDNFLSDTPIEEEDEDELETITPEEDAKRKAEAKRKQIEAAKAAKNKAAISEKKKPTADEIVFGEETEDDEDEQEKEEEETKDDDNIEDEPERNEYEHFAKDLVRLGVLTQTDEADPLPKTGEELLAKFQQEKQAGAVQWLDGFLSKFGEDRRDLFDAIFIDGVSPRDFLPLYTQIENLETIDITKEDNQEMVFREFYKRIKIPSDKIEIKLQKARDNGDLESDSKEFLDQIIVQDKEKAEGLREKEANKQQTEKKIDSEYKASLSKILMEKVKAREINGIPVTQEMANKAFDFLYTKKFKTQDGQFLTEFDKFIMETKRPENIENRLLLAFLKLTNFDFSKITKRAVSKQSSELFSTFAQRQAKKTPGAGGQKATVSKDWLEL